MARNPNSARTKVRRIPDRGHYDRTTINEVLDAGLVCQVGFIEDGVPVVIPMLYARDGDEVLMHGSTASRLTQLLATGSQVCVNVTILDGFVLARSAFHSSMNYRSVVIFGRPQPVDDPARKVHALRLFTEHMMPGRWDDVRPPTDIELSATRVLCMTIEEGSAKIRTGPPKDDPDDLSLPIWAGVVPLALHRKAEKSETPTIPVPSYVRNDRRFL
jgi:uncharacterized protein